MAKYRSVKSSGEYDGEVFIAEAKPSLFAKGESALSLGRETDDDTLPSDLALRLSMDRGYQRIFSDSWETDVTIDYTPPDMELVMHRANVSTDTNRYASRFTWQNEQGVLQYTIRINRESGVAVYTDDTKLAMKWIRAVQKHYRRIDTSDNPHEIDFHFWSMAHNGPSYIRRRIVVPKWKEISNNYSALTHSGLGTMMQEDYRPDVTANGQLILWHGNPGTGKTYAIRSLANEWRSWCDFEYIVDPEKFFGSESSYLMSVLLGNHRESYGEDEVNTPRRWRALIFEDTGELLTADAKERSGQGLSRLLNVVDGIIGQGLQLLVIITTNEDLSSLHPAVSRPGRTASIIQFNELDAEESTKWAKKNKLTIEGRPHTLAELFAESHGIGVRATPTKKKLGFTPS
jgi:hypothetical protein